METLFHITEKDQWEKALESGIYIPCSFEDERFIHLSTQNQWQKTLAKFYKDKKNLLLLEIPAIKLQDKLKWEDLMGEGQLFPHYFDSIKVNLVSKVSRIPNERC
jgi:uncharacterized protein (DUF952 family)